VILQHLDVLDVTDGLGQQIFGQIAQGYFNDFGEECTAGFLGDLQVTALVANDFFVLKIM